MNSKDSFRRASITFDVPRGVLGDAPGRLEVASFLVSDRNGFVLIDTGVPGSIGVIGERLEAARGTWSDITDVVLTHHHFDHAGGLGDVVERSPAAVLWAGEAELPFISTAGVRPLADGARVGPLRAIATPGHTAGHMSFHHEAEDTIFVGDLVGSLAGEIVFGPPPFTADQRKLRGSLRDVLELPAGRLVFSHGPEVPEPHAAVRALLERTSAEDG